MTEHANSVSAMLTQSGPDLVVVARALDALRASQGTTTLDTAAASVLCVAVSRLSGRHVATTTQVAAWMLESPSRVALTHLLLHVTSSHLEPEIHAIGLLLIARQLARTDESSAAFRDATVAPLENFLLETWKRERARSPHEWIYHPRRGSIGALVVRQFLSDLLRASPMLRRDAEAGRVATDLNVGFSSHGRTKTLDCVIGRPAEAVEVASDADHPLRKARLADSIIAIEVKACMTSHRQANSRLIDELHSSVAVVKSQDQSVIPVAIVIVNVAPAFTNPLNLPGPNKHVPAEIERVFERVVERVRLDNGSGTEVAYGGLALVAVDVDNESRFREASRVGRVPSTHTYERCVGRVASLYERRVR